MGHTGGLRSGTRHSFARKFRKHGAAPLTTFLRVYKVGDIVDIHVNGAVHQGMPFKVYNGKTGVIYNVTKSSVGIIIYKQVGNRYLEKRINVRVEHVRPSRSREDFLRRVKVNHDLKQKAKAEGKPILLKRQPVGPREGHTLSYENNEPETVTPVAYETTI